MYHYAKSMSIISRRNAGELALVHPVYDSEEEYEEFVLPSRSDEETEEYLSPSASYSDYDSESPVASPRYSAPSDSPPRVSPSRNLIRSPSRSPSRSRFSSPKRRSSPSIRTISRSALLEMVRSEKHVKSGPLIDIHSATYEAALMGVAPLEKVKKRQFWAYTDGSYNKTSGEYGAGGIIFESQEEYHRFSISGNNAEKALQHNMAGEALGAEYAFQYALLKGADILDLYYDAEAIYGWAEGGWVANTATGRDYKVVYDLAKESLEIRFHKVDSHTQDLFNDMADLLAKYATRTNEYTREGKTLDDLIVKQYEQRRNR